jgi:nucleotide-binding universal stress UspA family protein
LARSATFLGRQALHFSFGVYKVIVAHVTRSPTVVVENGQVTTGSAASKPVNLWHKFQTLVPNDPDVRVTHEVIVVGRKSPAGTVRLLEDFGCDLIVIGSHGHGRLRRLLRGSRTDEVVRHAQCPVLVVKAPATHRGQPRVRPSNSTASPLGHP